MADEQTETASSASKFASRKFLLTLLVLIAGAAAFLDRRFDAAQVIDLTKWILGLYFAGNVGTWLADALKGRLP